MWTRVICHFRPLMEFLLFVSVPVQCTDVGCVNVVIFNGFCTLCCRTTKHCLGFIVVFLNAQEFLLDFSSTQMKGHKLIFHMTAQFGQHWFLIVVGLCVKVEWLYVCVFSLLLFIWKPHAFAWHSTWNEYNQLESFNGNGVCVCFVRACVFAVGFWNFKSCHNGFRGQLSKHFACESFLLFGSDTQSEHVQICVWRFIL